METTIPGALADHLATEYIGDPETAEALDGARRGRGRTLVITPTSTRPLHIISRHAESILAVPSAHTRAEREAARLWIKRAGHSPAILTHRFASTGEAYDDTQCREDIRDGDVLIVEAEQVVGILVRAWPAAITAERGELHRVDGDPRTLDDGKYAASVDEAERVARKLEFPLTAEQADAMFRSAIDNMTRTNNSSSLALLVRYAAPLWRHANSSQDGAPAEFYAIMSEARETTHLDTLAALARRAAALWQSAEDSEQQLAPAEDTEAQLAAELVTAAEAAAGTWRGEWIGEQQDDDALFAVEQAAEQGALFAPGSRVICADGVERTVEGMVERRNEPARVAVEGGAEWIADNCHAASEQPAETVAPEVTRASVDAYLARTYPALFAPEQRRPVELEPALMWSVAHRVVIRGEWQGLIMCGLGRREADDRAYVLRYAGSKAVEVAPCEHGPNAHRDARLATRCEGCGYVVPRGEQWHDACRPRPRLTPLERRRLAEQRDAGWARAIEASDRFTEQHGEPPF
ncbi:hypothetical protein ACXZ65_33895 [Streptomyces aculeolatus]